MVDPQQELHKILSPYLTHMSKKVTSLWPGLEPELCLIHWLCTRNNIKPPYMPLQKITAQAEDPLKNDGKDLRSLLKQSPSPDRESTVTPSSLPTVRETPSSVSRDLELSPTAPEASQGLQRKWIRPEAKYGRQTFEQQRPATSPASSQDQRPSNKAALPPAEPARAESAQEVHTNTVSNVEDEVEQQMHPICFRSLGIVNQKIRDDARRHGLGVQDLRGHADGLTDVMHNMRMGLRGKFIANVPLLSLDVLSLEEQEKIVGKVRVKNYPAGANIVTEGDVGDCLYIVERGLCKIFKMLDGQQTFIKRIDHAGDFFGELAVMYAVPRGATVDAETSTTVLTLSRDDLFKTISSERIDKMRRVARAQFLSGIALLQPLNLKQKVAVAEHLQSKSWKAGQIICRQNEHVAGETQCMYIIEDGDCGVLKESKGKADQGDMHIMRPGQNFGMLGLLYGAPRAATVTAVKNCKTLSITYDELLRAIATCEKTCGKGLLKEMRTAVRTHLVRRIPTFKSVTDETIADLVKRLREVHYKRWQPIFMEGDQAKSILVLEEGVCIEHHGDVSELKEWRYRESAAEVEEHNNPGTFFGADCVTNSNAQNEFTLVAITECTVLDIPRDLIRSVLPATNGGSLTLSQQTRKIGS